MKHALRTSSVLGTVQSTPLGTANTFQVLVLRESVTMCGVLCARLALQPPYGQVCTCYTEYSVTAHYLAQEAQTACPHGTTSPSPPICAPPSLPLAPSLTFPELYILRAHRAGDRRAFFVCFFSSITSPSVLLRRPISPPHDPSRPPGEGVRSIL